MNLLAYDESRTLLHFARSVLLGLGERVSISVEPADARSKLDTGLFDAILIGPSGAPREFAEHLDAAFPELPVIVLGVPHAVEPAGRIRAVLERPLSVSRLVSAVLRLRHERVEAPAAAWPVIVAAGGDRIECRATRLAGASLLLEPVPDRAAADFGAFFSRHAGGRIAAESGGRSIAGEVAFAESRFAGVRLESCTELPTSSA